MKRHVKWWPAVIGVVALMSILIATTVIRDGNQEKVVSNNSSMPHTQEEINVFKQALFQSLQCQYSCPAENVSMNNETRYLPNPVCISACTQALKDKNLPPLSSFNKTELITDDLFKDIEQAHILCTNQNTNETSGERDDVQFFACMDKKLEEIKVHYPYV